MVILPGFLRDWEGALVLPRGKKTPVPQDVPLESEPPKKSSCISEPGCWCVGAGRVKQVLRPISIPTRPNPLF